MKLISVLMAIYIMVLSIVPCTDGISQIDLYPTIEISVEEDHHDHTHDAEDSCTPCCVCSCCGTVMMVPSISSISRYRVDLAPTYQFPYTFDYSFDYKNGVWHPPTFS